MAAHTAGSPMNAHLQWTNLTVAKFVQAFAAQGLATSRFIVRQVTRAHGLGQRQMSKKLTIKEVAHRDEQFQRLARLTRKRKSLSGNCIGRANPIVPRRCRSMTTIFRV